MVLAQPRKQRGNTTFDRMRGATSNLRNNSTAAEQVRLEVLRLGLIIKTALITTGMEVEQILRITCSAVSPGFFDVVAYTGDGVVGSTTAHNS
jgi:hypothetical protein